MVHRSSTMLLSVALVVFLLGVLDSAWGRGFGNEEEEDMSEETRIKRWIEEMDTQYCNLTTDRMLAGWNYNVNITDETKRLADEATQRFGNWENGACKNAPKFNLENITDPVILRQLRFYMHCPDTTAKPDRDGGKAYELIGVMGTIYATAKICKDESGQASGNGSDCISENPGLIKVMATSRDWKELLWAWEGWRNVTGRKMRPTYNALVPLLYKNAKKGGGSQHGMDNFSAVCEDLWQQMKPLYQQLHAYVRRKLMQSYPQNVQDFPSTRQIPAHILGNIWAQEWDVIADLVKPFPESYAVNLTKIMRDQGFTATRIFREADAFFTSLGLPPMTQDFWDNSLFEKPTDGRKVNCAPHSFDFFDKKSYRIKQCTDVTTQFFVLTHKNMGYLQYYMNYKDQPTIFHYAPSPGFADGVGDIIVLSAMTPQHLRNIKLLNDTTTVDYGSEINTLMEYALRKVAFLPFGYLLDKFRWDVADGTIAQGNYTKGFWKLRCGMQGLSPPVPRSEEDFDPGAKFHVSVNYPYINYFVGGIIQFQFLKSLCDAAGHVGPLHKCDIYNSTAAGDKLRSVLSLGGSKSWEEAMEVMTGQRNIDAGPLLEYFRPLQEWLEKENKDEDVGWDDECPSGSMV